MAKNRTIWIAGPVRYIDDLHSDTPYRWEFVGLNTVNGLRFWRLTYHAHKRTFVSTSKKTSEWEQSHALQIADIYVRTAVLYDHLPSGSIAVKLTSMLTDKDRAAAIARSIIGKKAPGVL